MDGCHQPEKPLSLEHLYMSKLRHLEILQLAPSNEQNLVHYVSNSHPAQITKLSGSILELIPKSTFLILPEILSQATAHWWAAPAPAAVPSAARSPGSAATPRNCLVSNSFGHALHGSKHANHMAIFLELYIIPWSKKSCFANHRKLCTPAHDQRGWVKVGNKDTGRWAGSPSLTLRACGWRQSEDVHRAIQYLSAGAMPKTRGQPCCTTAGHCFHRVLRLRLRWRQLRVAQRASMMTSAARPSGMLPLRTSRVQKMGLLGTGRCETKDDPSAGTMGSNVLLDVMKFPEWPDSTFLGPLKWFSNVSNTANQMGLSENGKYPPMFVAIKTKGTLWVTIT